MDRHSVHLDSQAHHAARLYLGDGLAIQEDPSGREEEMNPAITLRCVLFRSPTLQRQRPPFSSGLPAINP